MLYILAHVGIIQVLRVLKLKVMGQNYCRLWRDFLEDQFSANERRAIFF